MDLASLQRSSCYWSDLCPAERRHRQLLLDGDKLAPSRSGKDAIQLPIGDDRQHHEKKPLSPALAVLVCTALYALAALVVFVGLVWLLFTNYWPITIAYFAFYGLSSSSTNLTMARACWAWANCTAFCRTRGR